ncbi:MAG: hypothetical protein LUO80_04025, partial [Methylococcaceae bacterium]|nr:hypothetical protein [Methylococcaceae bacterium]
FSQERPENQRVIPTRSCQEICRCRCFSVLKGLDRLLHVEFCRSRVLQLLAIGQNPLPGVWICQSE